MGMVSYLKVIEEEESRRGFSGVCEDGGDYEEKYEHLLGYLRKEFFADKYTLCLQIRDKVDDSVVYEFPRVVCPELFLEQLRIERF